MSLVLILGLSVVAFGAAFLQGAIGIGFALILAPVLGLVAPWMLPVTLLVLMLPLNGLVAWRERASVDWRGAGWITLGRFAGTFAGIWLLAVLSVGQLDLAVGWFTVAAALAALIAPRFDPGRPAALAVGLVTGITETSTGIGGPPLALLYQHAAAPVLRATVAVCFLAGEVISLVMLVLAGQGTRAQWLGALALIPAVLAGTALSRLTHRRIGGQGLRVAVLVFALVSGGLLILR
ncbi:MAG: sulfite exporter TauE/SafE family protein [Rhodobacter sp.]|uniref:sulfite exporter TauE/SafE family protein n=1 Tax=Pararhodobacter sp. TaxID=2127056 RepID=UPI002CADC49B|nr:sulfite exporter TauE/SafE family protein [Pararhodobacter sp.]MCC0074860.1 sulfite exporter TauE/SafE family protein [Rhodobacter sp.]HPD90860.1 sulfite exporter TauE/SafE family protein [Pararhodobacter sp.]